MFYYIKIFENFDLHLLFVIINEKVQSQIKCSIVSFVISCFYVLK